MASADRCLIVSVESEPRSHEETGLREELIAVVAQALYEIGDDYDPPNARVVAARLL